MEFATCLVNLRLSKGISNTFNGSSDILTKCATDSTKNKIKQPFNLIKASMFHYKSIKHHINNYAN